MGALLATAKHVAAQSGKLQIARTLLRVNQPDGFDCPGCAWPEPKDTSAFEFCENGAKAVAWEATKDRVGPDFFARHTVTYLREQSDHWLESQGRLTHPMRYDAAADRFVPVSWDDAFAQVAERLNGLDDPDRAVFYTSGRTSNEAAFLYQLMGRKFGTNNFPDCSNLCHESSGVALGESIGIGKGTVTLEDFEQADAIFVIGQNPGTNHPRMLTELQKAAQRGAKIVSVNPLKERGLVAFTHPQHKLATLTGQATPISSHFVQPVIGGDLALFKGLCKLTLEADDQQGGGVIDREFVVEHTASFEGFAADLRATDWATIEAELGLSRAQLEEIARVYLDANRVIACWAMGLTQQRHGVAAIQMIVNLLLMRGHVGRPGAGACPVRGHSNVQGDRTMGIVEKPPPFSDKLGEVFRFSPPTKHGYDVVHAIRAMRDGRVGVFVTMGGNFAAASPDTGTTYAALANCDLAVHVATKLNRTHTVIGNDALILPCLGRTERDETPRGLQRITVEDSMSVVHASAGRNPPASEHLRSEPSIVCGLALALFGSDDPVPWEDFAQDYGLIRDRIAAVVPGFEDFNQRVDPDQHPGGFYLGNSARDRTWNNAAQKAVFTVTPIPRTELLPGQLRLMTLRSHDQYNTTVYGLNDRYRGIDNRRDVVFLNADDLAKRGLADADRVDLTSDYGDGVQRVVENFAAVAYDIPRGCAAGYFPELNPLVSLDAVALRSNTPVSKLIPVTVARAGS